MSFSCLANHQQLEQAWCDLQERANCSYFQSWGWISTWLDKVVADREPLIVEIRIDERLVGLGIFLQKDVKRHFVITSHSLFLNEYPFEDRDMAIEYNALLVECGREDEVYQAVIEHLLAECEGHEELHFGAVTESAAGSLEKTAAGRWNCSILDKSVAWIADLSGMDAEMDSYLATLSSNSRSQIRRAIRLYEKQAPLDVSSARDAREALEYFDRLKALHVAAWGGRGFGNGAFANPRWEKFHRTLIRSRFESGEVQLLRVAHGGKDLAYIYNHLWRGRVYMQQTGIEVVDDNRLKPGYVAHALAILYNLGREMRLYDFMHGDARYKRTLSNRKQRLYWIVLQQRKLKFRVEDLLVAAVRRYRSRSG